MATPDGWTDAGVVVVTPITPQDGARSDDAASKSGWFRSWSLGRFELEVEWIPAARYYTFTFSINTPVEWGKERGLL